jgi:hypothetical protein
MNGGFPAFSQKRFKLPTSKMTFWAVPVKINSWNGFSSVPTITGFPLWSFRSARVFSGGDFA